MYLVNGLARKAWVFIFANRHTCDSVIPLHSKWGVLHNTHMQIVFHVN